MNSETQTNAEIPRCISNDLCVRIVFCFKMFPTLHCSGVVEIIIDIAF